MQAAARAVTDALPQRRLHVLAGQGHDIDPEATASVIADFLGTEPGGSSARPPDVP